MTPIAYWCSQCAGAIFQAREDNVLAVPGPCQKCGKAGKLHRVEPPQSREETHA